MLRGKLNGLTHAVPGALLLLLMLAGIPAWGGEGPAAGLLTYRTQGADGEAILSRIWVTPDFLRIDQGEEDPGFILFDRRSGAVYSVSAEEKSVLVIEHSDGGEGGKAPFPFVLTRQSEFDAPKVGGREPEAWRLFADRELCQEAVVAPELMTGAGNAYREYLQALGRQNAVGLSGIPEAFRSECDDLLNVYAPGLMFEKGLILRSRESDGRVMELIDFAPSREVPDSYFRLPPDYRRIPLTDLAS